MVTIPYHIPFLDMAFAASALNMLVLGFLQFCVCVLSVLNIEFHYVSQIHVLSVEEFAHGDRDTADSYVTTGMFI